MPIRRPFLALIVAALLAPAAPAVADSGCLLKAMRKTVKVMHDASAEIEIDLTPEVMRLITTRDRTLRPALDGSRPPRWLVDWMRKKRIKGPPEELAWDRLGYDQQIKLLRYAASKRGVSFFDDRSIHGMVVRDRIELTFKQPVVFEGKRYPKGRHVMPRRYLMEKVEHGGPTMVETMDGVELHYRRRLPAGDLISEVWKFEEGLGMRRTHLHIHMVAPIKPARIRDPLGVARHVDFIGRSNLAAEMVTILESAGRITTNADKTGMHFDSFSKAAYDNLVEYFTDLGHGTAKPIADDFKDGWIGVRGPDAYDQPGLWGLEYRAIDGADNPKIMREVLNGIQGRMVSGDYGVSDARLKKWLGFRDPREAMFDAMPNGEWKDVISAMPSELSESTAWLKRYIRHQEYKENHGLKMIFHDWSKHPLFFDRPANLKKILAEQQAAIRELKEGTNPDEVIRRFLLKSGLYEDVLGSVGVKVTRVKKALSNNTWEDLEDLDEADEFDDF